MTDSLSVLSAAMLYQSSDVELRFSSLKKLDDLALALIKSISNPGETRSLDIRDAQVAAAWSTPQRTVRGNAAHGRTSAAPREPRAILQ